MALGLAFVGAIWRAAAQRFGARALVPTAVLTLTLVWLVNFFLVLPVLNPAFVSLMPYAVTLASKVLFGIAMAGVLQFTMTDGPGRRCLVAARPSYYPIKW